LILTLQTVSKKLNKILIPKNKMTNAVVFRRLKEQQKAILADRDLNEKLLSARLSEAQKSQQESEKQMLVAKASESRLKQELCISEQRVQALEGDHARVKQLVEKQFAKQLNDLENKIEQLKAERDAQLSQVHSR